MNSVVLLGVEHFEQCRRRITAEVGTHLVDLVEQEQRVRSFGLSHALDDLARHRADIGPPVTADLRLIVHAAQRKANEFASGRLGDRPAKRGLADAGRADQAQNRPGQLVGALLDREVFDDPLLDLVETVMIIVENLLGKFEVLLDPGALGPRDRKEPVEVIAHHSGFRRHQRHLPELLELVRSPSRVPPSRAWSS